MTIAEIFEQISAHQIEGLMLHEQLADYFDFLSLHGYKRMHEYHYLDESVAMRGVHRYYINHYNKLIAGAHPRNPDVIPANWFNYERSAVEASTKKKSTAAAFEAWVKWETETKKMYERMYKEACDIDEVAAAIKIKDLICDVDKELKYATRMWLELKSVDYSLEFIYMKQQELHEYYREKEKELGVDIC